MERLTEEKQIGPWASLKDHAEAIPGAFANYDCLMAHMTAVTRLKAYEDTGFMPEDLSAACSADTLTRVLARAYNVNPDDLREAMLALKEGRYIIMRDAEQEGVARLRELSKADKDGRVEPVIRCRDCAHWGPEGENAESCVCWELSDAVLEDYHYTPPDGYCYKAERKEAVENG